MRERERERERERGRERGREREGFSPPSKTTNEYIFLAYYSHSRSFVRAHKRFEKKMSPLSKVAIEKAAVCCKIVIIDTGCAKMNVLVLRLLPHSVPLFFPF